ncbi:filamentous hemagglutinin N-terminal domain-containing protein [Oxalobacteraceae bacterium A2-2]
MRTRSILRSTQRLRRTLALPVAVALPMAAPSYAQNLPTGAVVTAGKASIGGAGANSLQVRQDSQRAVVRWSSFNIGQGNAVNFVQPNAAAATLNVVGGADASQLAGKLSANGSVFVINQNGIAITNSGAVDVRGGFVASTLGMSEDDFMHGRLVFQGQGGAVRNAGSIVAGEGGYVALLGSSVANAGLIAAPLGKVALASGQAVTLDLSGDGYLQVLAPAGATSADGQPLVSNSGVIQADGGSVVLKAATVQQALREAVYMPGEIRARSVSGRDGAVVLEGGEGGAVRVSGHIDAAAAEGEASGGRIDIGGHSVALSGATLDASGNERGGLVRVGGAFQGGRAQQAGSADAARYVERYGAAAAPTSAASTSIDAASSIDVSARGAQGEGGTAVVWSQQATVMAGAIDGRGARAAGAVEVSSASTVQAVALDRIALGKGGKLLLDPQDIQISDGATSDASASVNYGDNPGGVTHLKTADLTALLGSGTNVSLQASQDISWNTFSAAVPRNGQAAAGDLTLAAGRSIILSGIFQNGDGHWTMVANDSAAHGVADAERGAGLASLNLGGASFINSNGRLDLTLADGAGNTNTAAGSIYLPGYSGDGLSATVLPSASSGIPGIGSYIMLNNVAVANDITLNGSLRLSNASATLSGASVDWQTESTDSISGEGLVKFVQGGVLTHIGALKNASATRLALGQGSGTYTRAYGDADPGAATLGQHLLHATAGVAADSIDAILQSGSLAVSGPGVTASAGSASLTLSATSGIAFASGLMGGYFINLADAVLPMTISKRTLTPTLASTVSTVYGTAAPVVSLSNIVNGDAVAPVATLDGASGTLLAASGSGYAFGARTAAGSHGYTLTGLGGGAAANYQLDLSGAISGSFEVSRKALTYTMQSASQTYGTLGAAPGATLDGVLGGDDVAGVAALSQGGVGVAHSARLNAGSYVSSLGGLAGADAANYQLAASGNTAGVYTVYPKALTYTTASASSTYGNLATLGTATLAGVLSGDSVTGGALLADGGGGSVFAPTERTAAGSYSLLLSGLGGASAGNYTLAASGNTLGSLTIAPRTLAYTLSDLTQTYGSTVLPQLALSGVLSGDSVSATAAILQSMPSAQQGGSGMLAVGSYLLGAGALDGSSAANYTLAGGAGATLKVLPKLLTVSGGDVHSVYGTSAVIAAPALGGVVSGDAIYANTSLYNTLGDPVAAYDRLAAGSYAIRVGLSGAGVGNYQLASNAAGTLTVAPRPLTWSARDTSVAYGDAIDTSGVTLAGALGGDDVRAVGQAMNSTGAIVARPMVGSYQWVVTGLQGSAAANYMLAASGNQGAALSVTPRQLQYQIVGSQSVYGEAMTPALSAYNLLPGDTVHVSYTVDGHGGDLTRLNAGTYRALVTGVDNPNYSAAPGYAFDFTVLPRPLWYTAPSLSMTYGDALPNGGYATLTGVLAGDQVSMPFNYYTGSLPRSASGNVLAGTYLIDVASPFLTGASAGNYKVASALDSSWLTVQKRAIGYHTEIAAPYSSVYGDIQGLPAVNTYLSGNYAGDDVRITGPAADFRLSGSGYLAAGQYTATGGSLYGADAANYVLSLAASSNATITVAARQVSNGWRLLDFYNNSLASLTYGDTNGGHLVFDSFTPLARDQVTRSVGVQIGGSLYSVLPPNMAAGDYGVYASLAGADAGNYALQGTGIQSGAIGRLTVKQRPISVQYGATSTEYGNFPVASATLSGAVAGDDIGVPAYVTDSAGRLYLAGERAPAGTYTVSAAQQLTGAAAANYVLAPEGGSWTSAFNGATVSVGPNSSGSATVYKRYLPSSYSGATSLVYGEMPAAIGIDLSRVLAGDDVSLRSMVYVNSTVSGASGIEYWIADTRLPVGSYRYFLNLLGADAGNYYTDTNAATLSVAPRVVTAAAASSTTVYGTRSEVGTGTVYGVLSGDSLAAVAAYTDSGGHAISYGERTNAGSYTTSVTGLQGLNGTNPLNYVLDTGASTKGNLLVQPRTIDLGLPATQTQTYGTSPVLGSRSGVLSGDQVAFTMVGDTGGLLSSIESGLLYLDKKVNVGSYSYSVQLSGASSANYRLANSSGAFTITPKELQWTVSAASGQYGNYQMCDCTNPASGVVLGNAIFQGVLAGDEVKGTVQLLDLAGAPVTINSKSPVGSYFQVVSDISGASAGNYKLAPSGNLPGIFNLVPLGVSWSVSSGIIMSGYGVAGNPGVATLYGPNGGGLLNGDVAYGVATMYDIGLNAVTNSASLKPGHYYYLVKGIVGPDAGNYRPLASSYDFWNNAGAWGGPNTVGTLDIYADTTLGLSYTKPQNLPAPPLVTPTKAVGAGNNQPLYNEVYTAPAGAGVPVTGAPLTAALDAASSTTSTIGGVAYDPGVVEDLLPSLPHQIRPVTLRQSGDNEDPLAFGRQNPGTGAGGGVSVNLTSVQAGGSTSAEAGTSTTVGGATVSTQAEVLAEALAKFGVSGVTLQASAEGHVDVMLQYGPGYVTYGAQGSAVATANIGRTGVAIEADASAGTYVGGGAAGGLGGVGSGSIGATTGAYASVNADYKYGIIDGVLTMKADSKVGVGVQAGVTGSISGNYGGAEGGVTVVSPGSLGASFNLTGAYDNGTISFALDIGAAIGIGGLELKLDVSIDLNEVAKVFTGLAERTPSVFARAASERDEVNRLAQAGDQVQLLEYLSSHSLWSQFGEEAPGFAMTKYKGLLSGYADLVSNAKQLVESERAYQAQMLKLLATDPQAAVDLAHDQQLQQQKATIRLRSDAARLGLRLGVQDSNLTFVD